MRACRQQPERISVARAPAHGDKDSGAGGWGGHGTHPSRVLSPDLEPPQSQGARNVNHGLTGLKKRASPAVAPNKACMHVAAAKRLSGMTHGSWRLVQHAVAGLSVSKAVGRDAPVPWFVISISRVLF